MRRVFDLEARADTSRRPPAFPARAAEDRGDHRRPRALRAQRRADQRAALGQKWLKLDLKAAAGKPGVDVAQLQSLSGGGDPTQFLTYLAKAGDVHKVGSEDVNGTPTTHHRATIDIEKLAGSAGKAADSVRQLERISGLKKLPTDIWIDASQRVRRQTVAIDARQPLPISFSLQIDYKRFGVPVDVQAPPADETVDYSAVAGG